jgi:nicotinamide mononucleotide transporter
MSELISSLFGTWNSMSSWELVAVSLALAYLLLALREHIACWYAAFISTAIYTVIFWHVSLLMDSLLNIYYMLMAVYGWFQWRKQTSNGNNSSKGSPTKNKRPISTWTGRQHLIALASIGLATVISGYTLEQYTQASWPYLDSFTTWASVITTYMVTQKILENWLYWIVIDAVAIGLYIERGLHFTALLFILYCIIAVIGFFAWRQHYHRQSQESFTQLDASNAS